MKAASGVAQAVRSQLLSIGDHVARRKASTHKVEEGYMGSFYKLPDCEQEALVDLARITMKEMRDVDRADHAALDEYKKARRQTNEDAELDELFTQYALALSFFERWQRRGVESMTEVTRALNSYGGAGQREQVCVLLHVCAACYAAFSSDCSPLCQDKLDWLREQIEMRTIGLGWTEQKARWSSTTDASIGSIEQLAAHLQEVLQMEGVQREAGVLPSKAAPSSQECPAPLLQRKTFKTLGTPTVQAGALCNARCELTAEQMLIAAQRRRADLEAAGEIDWVADRQPHPTGQGPVCNSSLVGKMLEVRWRYRHKETGEPVYIWCEGLVMQVCSLSHHDSSHCHSITHACLL